MKRIAPEWYEILVHCQVKPTTAAIWSEVFAGCIGQDTFSTGDDDLRAFLGQVLHESRMLECLEENLNYSAQRLCQVWPHRFPTVQAATPYAHDGPALAERVYGGRMGNVKPGDGWKYRGRGLIECTGLTNYVLVESLTGLPVIEHPELLARPVEALQSAIAWWERSIPDAILGDIERVTRRVNGGTEGEDRREALTERATEALG